MPRATDGEVLRFDTSEVLPPFAFIKMTRADPSGADIEMARMIAARVNRPIEIKVMPFGDLIPSLINDKVDFIGGAITIAPERRRIISFSTGYFGIGVVALVRQ